METLAIVLLAVVAIWGAEAKAILPYCNAGTDDSHWGPVSMSIPKALVECFPSFWAVASVAVCEKKFEQLS